MDLSKRAWGTEPEEAAVAAEALTVETEQRGNAVKLRYRPPERIEIGARRGADRIDFRIRVPTQTAVTLVTGSGDVQLTGTSGVSLEGARGSLDLESEFGGINVTGAIAAVLNLRTGNGGIEFAGSLDPAADHAVHSNFGDIQLTIPADSSFDAELETTFGRIESDLPITLAGEIRKDRWRGRLNEGGARLSVTTRNGSIELRALTDS